MSTKSPYASVLEELRLHAASAVCTLEPKDCARIVKVLEAQVMAEPSKLCHRCSRTLSPIYLCDHCD